MTYPDTPSTKADRDRVVAAATGRALYLQKLAETVTTYARHAGPFGTALLLTVAAELRQLAGEKPDDDEARR